MGVVNVTPDSFSDGGNTPEEALKAARALIKEGADILDIGGESTRPGAKPISLDEELSRVIPVIEALSGEGTPVSVDTRHAGVMAAAIAAGVSIVNDVTAFEGDSQSLAVVASSNASVVLMHMRGNPQNMQDDPVYTDVVAEVYDYLSGRIAACQSAGITKGRIAIDPGIGFGKNLPHNLELMRNLNVFSDLGCPLVLGVSRKSFIGQLSGQDAPALRLAGSLAAALSGVRRGAAIVRVHDVAQTRQALDVWRAIET